jgi:error-prone DNA polymerase
LKSLDRIEQASPLAQMTAKERLHADFSGLGLTVGKHPMSFYREEMDRRGVYRATELEHARPGEIVKVAGAVIVRQRPGTAKGFLFISLEDETGVANIIVTPAMFDRQKSTLVHQPFLMIEGVLQNQNGAISIQAGRAEAFDVNAIPVPSHDFH